MVVGTSRTNSTPTPLARNWAEAVRVSEELLRNVK
jgi:hypothetical protein